MKFDAGAATPIEKEANVDDALAYDHRFSVGKDAAADVDAKIAGAEPGERSMHAALELVLRRARPNRFAHGKCEELSHAQWRREGESRRAAGGDGVEIERHADANHTYLLAPLRGAACRQGVPYSIDVPIREFAG